MNSAQKCRACGHRCEGPDVDDLESTARHEAGHTIMRALRLGVEYVGDTCIHSDGTGLSMPARPTEVRGGDNLLITVAGYAAEYGSLELRERFGYAPIPDANLQGVHGGESDLDTLCTILTPDFLSRSFFNPNAYPALVPMTQQEAIRNRWEWASELLQMYDDLCEDFAFRLERKRILRGSAARKLIGPWMQPSHGS